MNDFIDQLLTKHLSPATQCQKLIAIAGGCINNTYKILTNRGPFFVKWNEEDLFEMFDAEAKGLAILDVHSPIITPKELGIGTLSNKSFLLTEWIEKGSQSDHFWENFAVNLAEQHAVTSSEFGLDHDNYIGSLEQSNKKHAHWSDFFIHTRLKPQITLASSKNLLNNIHQSQFEELYQKLDDLIPLEKPALLHGDLWSGNFMAEHSGEAAIYDPAVHFGHRETELAFTQLFGGFSEKFYTQYHEVSPLETGFADRVDIHNLYPILVHLNLFGSSYLSGITQTLNRFC